MRTFATLVLLFATGVTLAQDYTNAYERQKGVVRIDQKTLCATCKQKERIATFLFDQDGFNIEEQTFDNGEKKGITRYFWKDGTLQSAQGYQAFSNKKLEKDPKAKAATTSTTIQIWDSTKISHEVRYTYAGPRLDKITSMDGEEQNIGHVTNLYYDNKGKVAREEHIDYPQTVPYYKTFKYVGDSVFIEYFKQDVRMGKGKKKFNKSGKLLYEATYNIAGVKVYECKNRYNQAGRILEQNIFETGVDGYGSHGELPGFEKITYRYDQLGKLAIVDKYFKGKVSVTDFYEYVLMAGK
ncbi:MAG: hypothetical protein ABIS36_20635 [Chryseolinea sp.]